MLSIVLSRHDFREYDQIIALYTQEKGKVEVLARGVKKITSKNSAHLEPFSLVDAEIVRGKEIDHLIKIQIVEYFIYIRQDFSKMFVANFVVGLVHKLLETKEPDIKIFQLIVDFLFFLEKNKVSSFLLLLDYWVLNLFSLLGFVPILDVCVNCGAGNLPNKQVGFHFASGGVVCEKYLIEKRKTKEMIVGIHQPLINYLSLFLNEKIEIINSINITEEEKREIHYLVYNFAVFHSERKIIDWGKLFQF